jgi:hypothetical protein
MSSMTLVPISTNVLNLSAFSILFINSWTIVDNFNSVNRLRVILWTRRIPLLKRCVQITRSWTLLIHFWANTNRHPPSWYRILLTMQRLSCYDGVWWKVIFYMALTSDLKCFSDTNHKFQNDFIAPGPEVRFSPLAYPGIFVGGEGV